MTHHRLLKTGAVTLLVITQLLAQSRTAPAPGATRSAVSQEEAAIAGGEIKVHGHWTIEVRNPDGSIASRREFENGLTQTGGAFLVSLLARQAPTFNWMVEVSTGAGPQLCGTNGSAGCMLVESALAGEAANIPGWLPVLNASAPTTGDNAGKFVLSGTANATTAGKIKVVGTRLRTPAGETYFTGTVLTLPVDVLAGQTMIVTVVISFS